MNVRPAVVLPFESVVNDVSAGNKKVQKSDYLPAGSYPVVDQGQEFVGGFSNAADDLVDGEGPWIVFGDHTRVLKYVDFPFCMGADGVKVLKPRSDSKVDAKYLFHFLSANEVPSAGYSRHYKFLKRLDIPLPPLDEQRRIAAILDKADDLRRKRKRAIELLDGLARATFLEIFGSPARNPRGWTRGRIGDLLDETQYGTSAKAGESGEYPILRMGNLTAHGEMDLSNLKYIDLDSKDLEKYTVKRGDILFNRTNSADLVGKTAVFDQDERFAFAGYLVRARVKNGFSPHYISGYLNSRHGKATLRRMAKSIVGMANINAREMESIPIFIPDTHTQRVFSDAIAQIASARDVAIRHLTLLNSAFSSLQSRAFSGQL